MRNYLLPIGAVIALIFAGYHVVHSQQPQERLPPPIAPAASPFGRQVAGLGLVEARMENVEIGSHVTGVATEVYVREGQKISGGAPLFQLDVRQAESDVKVREAMLVAAEAQLERLHAMPRTEELPAMDAQVQEARTNVKLKEDTVQRSKKLVNSGAVADETVVRDQLSLEVSRAQLERMVAQDKLLRAGAWAADKAVSQAAVEQAKAQLDQAKTELERHRVLAPELVDADGNPVEWEVLRVNLRPGEFVSTPSSEALIVLGDTGSRHVRVDIDENDIPRFRPASTAEAYARGSAERKYALRFVRVQPFVVPKKSLSGDNAERVDTRVLQVIYAIENDDRSVFVGQQMDVFIQAKDDAATN